MAQRPVDEPAVAHAVSQLAFERADRHEVLGRARVDVGLARHERQHRGRAVGDRGGLVADEVARRLAPHDARPGMPALQHREPQVPGVARVRGRAAMQNIGERCPGASSAITPLWRRLEVGDPMGLHVAHRRVLSDLLQRAVGHDRALRSQRLGALSLGVAHLRVQGHHQQVRVVARSPGGADPGSRSTGGICSPLPPASTAHRSMRTSATSERRGLAVPDHGADRERADEAGGRPVLGVVEGQPGVDAPHAVDERDAVDAVVVRPRSAPSRRSRRSCRRILRRGRGRRPGRAGCRSRGPTPRRRCAPCARIVPGHPDTSAEPRPALVSVRLERSRLDSTTTAKRSPSHTSTRSRIALGQQCGSSGS